MTFHILQNSTTADANDENDNFYHIGQGSRLPMGGQSLTVTDGVYDLGASGTAWNNLYCNNIYSTNGIITDGAGLWTKIADYTLSSVTSRIEISSLDETDMLNCFIYSPQNVSASTSVNIHMVINGDSSASYAFQRLYANNALVISNNDTSVTSITMITRNIDGAIFGEFLIYSKVGRDRIVLLNWSGQQGGSSINLCGQQANIWSNTSTITSLVFYMSGENFAVNTNIIIFKKG